MTVLIVIAMVATVALLQWSTQRRRARLASLARRAVQYVRGSPSLYPPRDVLLHPGHSWVRLHGDELASVGASSLAAGFAGELASVELPREGQRLRQAEPMCTFVSTANRRVELPMPIAGKVLAVNPALAGDPSLVQRRAYDEGWLFRVRPRRLGSSLRNLLSPEAGRAWLDATRAAIVGRLQPTVGAALGDGGELDPAYGERIPDGEWASLRSELFESAAHAQEAVR